LAGREKAVQVLQRNGIDALIPIGGDGTIRGAIELGKIWDGKIVACPGTIDNDLIGSDYTIGFATAVQTAVEAIDKIRDTAESHERMFLVEVMGRHSGYIAAYAALAGAAEMVCIPETPTDIPRLVAQLERLRLREKESVMMVVAEGDEFGNAQRIGEMLQEAGSPFAMRVVVLGHLQRGGSPCPEDRLLATQLGAWAVEAAVAGKTNVMVGRQGFACQLTELPDTVKVHRPIPPDLLQLIDALSH
jgi:6-phosphofructokinase 1